MFCGDAAMPSPPVTDYTLHLTGTRPRVPAITYTLTGATRAMVDHTAAAWHPSAAAKKEEEDMPLSSLTPVTRSGRRRGGKGVPLSCISQQAA